MIIEGVCEDLDIVAEGVRIWSPNELKRFLIHPLVLVLVVESCEEPSVEAHLSKYSCVGAGVSEWVDLPSDSRFDSEFSEDEFMTEHHVFNHVLVGGTGFIVH